MDVNQIYCVYCGDHFAIKQIKTEGKHKFPDKQPVRECIASIITSQEIAKNK